MKRETVIRLAVVAGVGLMALSVAVGTKALIWAGVIIALSATVLDFGE